MTSQQEGQFPGRLTWWLYRLGAQLLAPLGRKNVRDWRKLRTGPAILTGEESNPPVAALEASAAGR